MKAALACIAAFALFLAPFDSEGARNQKKRATKATRSTQSTPQKKTPTAVRFTYPEGKELVASDLGEIQRALPKASANFRSLTLAMRKWTEGKTAEALSALPKSVGDEDGDLPAWLHAMISLEQGQGQIAAQKLIWIYQHTPDSPYFKRLPAELGRAELLQARNLAKSKEIRRAQAMFSRAFERLADSGMLAHSLTTADAGDFARVCKAKPTLDCENWLKKLSSITAKNGPEFAALRKDSPSFPDRPQAPSFEYKGPLSYRESVPDPDNLDAAVAFYLKEDWDEAKKTIRAILESYPRSASRYRARYLLATAYARDNDKEDAHREFESLYQDAALTFYGMLAGWQLQKQVSSLITKDKVPLRTRDPYLSADELKRLRRAENLLSAHAKTLAAMELSMIRPRAQLSSGFLLYAAALQTLAGAHTSAFAILSDLISRDDPTIRTRFFLEMIFPRTHFDLIKQVAGEEQVDPLLIISLIKQESAFDVDAVSRSGAGGLMQLMPATAAEVIDGTERTAIRDPKHNLRLGIRYLKKMIERFGGSIPLALAAYNAGPSAVERWLKDPAGLMKDKQGIELWEAIPIRETREYVPAIMRNYYWYSYLIEDRTLEKTF